MTTDAPVSTTLTPGLSTKERRTIVELAKQGGDLGGVSWLVKRLQELDTALTRAEAERDAERARREKAQQALLRFAGSLADGSRCWCTTSRMHLLNVREGDIRHNEQCEEARAVLTEEHD